MKLIHKLGVTSVVLRLFLPDSTSATGAGKTGLTSASSGLIISTIASNEASPTTYTAAGSTIETITTLGTFAAPTDTKCRFNEVDATNFPGVYEVQIADARYAVASARNLQISVQATGVAPTFAEVQFVSYDPYDTVRLGLTAMPNAVAGANGGLPTGDASARVTLTPTTIQAIWDVLTSALTTAGTIGKRISDYLTGDSYVRLGAPANASVSADIAAVLSAAGGGENAAVQLVQTPLRTRPTDYESQTVDVGVGDALTLRFDVLDAADDPVSLSGATVTGRLYNLASTQVGANMSATIIDAAGGRCSVALLSTHTATAGTYRFHLTIVGGSTVTAGPTTVKVS